MANALSAGIQNRHKGVRNVAVTVKSCRAVTATRRAAVRYNGFLLLLLWVKGFRGIGVMLSVSSGGRRALGAWRTARQLMLLCQAAAGASRAAVTNVNALSSAEAGATAAAACVHLLTAVRQSRLCINRLLLAVISCCCCLLCRLLGKPTAST
jgi:hypothetical protein